LSAAAVAAAAVLAVEVVQVGFAQARLPWPPKPIRLPLVLGVLEAFGRIQHQVRLLLVVIQFFLQ